jgi:hypothetical protein
MIAEGYDKKAVIGKIKCYGIHWIPSMGKWERVLRSILAHF